MKKIKVPQGLEDIKTFALVPDPKYAGTSFTTKIGKCNCGKEAAEVKARVYFGGDVVNEKDGSTYLECDFEYFCKNHNRD